MARLRGDAAISGFRVDDFVVDSVLGEGGMGRVYRARQSTLDRWVALKVLPRARENPTFIERFHREARAAARLVHPNIIQIHTVGEHQGIPYYAMEYIEGTDLDHIIRDGDPLSADEIVAIVRAVLKALALANEHAIVHRDLKPANLMITRQGIVKVTDFGLAKGHDHGLTQAGLIVGTPAYMSPEQGASRPLDIRSDFYSLGCLMYECICGRPPFEATNIGALIFKHLYDAPEPIAALRQGFSEAVAAICMKLLAKNADERFQTPEEAMAVLAGVPCNPITGETSLAGRSQTCLQRRKQQLAGKTFDLSQDDFFRAPTSAATGSPFIAAPSPPATLSGELAVGGRGKASPKPPGPPPSTGSADFLTRRPSPSLAPVSTPQSVAGSTVPFRPSAVATAEVSPSTSRAAPTVQRRSVTLTEFIKRPDGRWSYESATAGCLHAAGLAAELRSSAPSADRGLADCLLCSNWTRRHGCAMAQSQALERQGTLSGLKLKVEQSIVWLTAGRFDKAVAVLEEHVRGNPGDPAGYRELARVYEHPEYRGTDRRRAIVLYQRFVELARAGSGFTAVEIARAGERITSLKAQPVPFDAASPKSGVIVFDCFYRGAIVCFSHGRMTRDRLVVARAGEVDPETGITSGDMSGGMGRATTIFRRFKSVQAKRDEADSVRKEMKRLSDLPFGALEKDPARVLAIDLSQVRSVDFLVEKPVHILTLSTAQQAHQLLFSDAAAFEAEQCLCLLTRRIS